jgi:hypothetical protein
MAVFYTAASLSGAFSGLLAFGIEKMDGIAGPYTLRNLLYLRSNWRLDSIRSFRLAMDVRTALYGFKSNHWHTSSFILEGLIPVALSFVIWKILPDSPETARFLNKKEKEFIINRLALETGSGHGRVTNNDRIRMHHIWAAFKEYKIWGSWVMFWGNTIGVYG